MKYKLVYIILILSGISSVNAQDYAFNKSIWNDPSYPWGSPLNINDGNDNTYATSGSISIACIDLNASYTFNETRIVYRIPTTASSLHVYTSTVSDCSIEDYTIGHFSGGSGSQTTEVKQFDDKSSRYIGLVRLNNPNTAYIHTINIYWSFNNTTSPIPTLNLNSTTLSGLSDCGFADIICGISVAYTGLWDITQSVFDFGYYILYSIFYIPIGIITSIINGFTLIFIDLYGVITDILGLMETVYNFINFSIGLLYDMVWVSLILTGFGLIVGFRIWSLIYAGAGAK